MTSDWDEIKRLASDFQKAQLTTSLQRLSERNCVEVVSLLIEKGLLEVIYTTDGKEYLTQVHLKQEVRDEMFVRGGRVNLVDLAKALNVDFEKVQVVAEQIVVEDRSVKFILGQLIEQFYMERVASEINEKLAQVGEINVADLTVQYDLPADFILNNIILRHLNKTIMGKQDSSNANIFFTQSYVARSKAKVRGALAAITKPTPVSAILAQCGIPDRLFNLLVNEVATLGSVTSRTPGALYIPHIYTKTQVEWVQNFYRQNGYLEHDSVAGLGVTDVKNFIVNQLPNEKIVHLKKCSVGEKLIDQVASSLEECISTSTYLDVSTVLPSIMSDEDVDQLLTIVLTAPMQKQVLIFNSTILTTKFVEDMIKPCYEIAVENAKKSVDSGTYQQYMAEKMMKHQDVIPDKESAENKADKRDERRKKAAGGKAGGGAQGRETKTKSTKKHARGHRGNVSDSDEDFGPAEKSAGGKKGAKEASIELITVKDISKVLHGGLEEEGLEDLAKQLAQHYYPQFSRLALAKAHELYEISLHQNNQNRRQTHANLQDKLNNLFNDIRLYEKGIKLLPADVQPQLVKYLLKSLGTDFCNEIFFYVAAECNLNSNGTTLTVEQRNKIAADCGQEYRGALQALNKATASSAAVDDFLIVAENSLQACSMILKKIDKKKDRNLILCHKHGLLEQLANCSDPALVLHLAVLILFTISTQSMLHASGRHVSAILSFLQPALAPEQAQTLTTYHDLVLKLLSVENASDDSKADADEVKQQLEKLTPTVKDIAGNYKKAGLTSAE
ncbi:E3 UFM1-protein ligase 1 homolog [Culex pipiens pallens]|uniref:E3 UFM1-protein ligase 1 homolog n=1 Tax=Culex pipiens pallens TaxID=42434 RepID=UPI0019543DC6|nr:E3 UFM1-protein ligase 1 homolog [Culex pipiens pallens]